MPILRWGHYWRQLLHFYDKLAKLLHFYYIFISVLWQFCINFEQIGVKLSDFTPFSRFFSALTDIHFARVTRQKKPSAVRQLGFSDYGVKQRF